MFTKGTNFVHRMEKNEFYTLVSNVVLIFVWQYINLLDIHRSINLSTGEDAEHG